MSGPLSHALMYTAPLLEPSTSSLVLTVETKQGKLAGTTLGSSFFYPAALLHLSGIV